MIIAMTGTPGTGKTKFSQELANELGYKVMDVNAFIYAHQEVIIEYDKQKKTQVIDEDKLSSMIEKKLEMDKGANMIIDSHLSHYLSPDFIDICVVLKCDLKILKERLKKRGYHEQKIKDNLEAEAFDAILTESEERHKKVVSFDTSSSPNVKKLLTEIKKSM